MEFLIARSSLAPVKLTGSLPANPPWLTRTVGLGAIIILRPASIAVSVPVLTCGFRQSMPASPLSHHAAATRQCHWASAGLLRTRRRPGDPAAWKIWNLNAGFVDSLWLFLNDCCINMHSNVYYISSKQENIVLTNSSWFIGKMFTHIISTVFRADPRAASNWQLVTACLFCGKIW